jgi:hypothetical protein
MAAMRANLAGNGSNGGTEESSLCPELRNSVSPRAMFSFSKRRGQADSVKNAEKMDSAFRFFADK